MSYTTTNNEQFFLRLKDWTTGLQQLLEERDRLIAIYQNETGNGTDPEFVDTPIATTAEASDLAVNVMNPVNNLINNGVTSQEDRVPYMTPFLQ